MAVYSKLLLSAGGGIISAVQQAEQVKNTATVLIGLGGTGIDCLRTIKTQVYSRLKADDPEAAAATYSHIRFLGIDTAERSKGFAAKEDDSIKTGSLMALDDTEFFSISNPNVKKAFKNPEAIKQRSELDWLVWENIDAPDLGKAGAGGIRQVGRYMMMDKSSLFLSRVEQEISRAKSGLTSPTVNIHIFSGLSGGTGSGAFLDVCYMVRSIADNIGGITIFGYFFLPDVNLSKIPFADTKTRAYIPMNGYAAMQELDYCMRIQSNGGSFVQEYQNHKKIEWKAPPVDMCHLICATNSSGDIIPDAYDHAMNVTAEYVMDFVTFSDTKHDLAEQLSNFRKKVNNNNSTKVIGSNLAYCIIGASCASLPLREINTYLASELFELFSGIGGNVPSRADVEKLAIAALSQSAQNVSDIYNGIVREIRDGADDSYAPYADDWKYVRDYGNKDLVTCYTDQTAGKKNSVEANAKSMVTAENEKSMLHKMRSYLSDVIKDLNRGPIYAHRLISAAESHNLLNIIDGLLEENRSRYNQEGAQNELRYKDYENAKSDFEKRRRRKIGDNDKKRFHDYEFYLMLLEQHNLSMYIYEKIDFVLKKFREQIMEAAANYYIKLSRVMETLINSFKENRAALASEKIMRSEGTFAIPMMTIGELKESLDKEIEKINIPGMLNIFMSLMLEKEDEWILEDENKICKLVTKFFVETAFGSFANRTITSFLKDKYGIDNDERLADKIYNDWMIKLTGKASPLFCFNNSVWTENDIGKLAFLSFPAASAPIKNAAKKMYDTDNLWVMKESALTDRIYVMCSACVLPLSAYNNCEEYEKSCFSSVETGRYYYEGKPVKGMIFNDWRKLPSLTPQSLINLEKVPDTMKELVASGRELYDKADKAGIFDDENRICKPDEKAAEKVYELAASCKETASRISTPEDTIAAADLLKELLESYPVLMKVTQYAMPNEGYAGEKEVKKRVCKDLFVASPAYHGKVREILSELDKLKTEVDSARKALEERISKINKGGQDMNAYCDAVFTGVIAVENVVVVYRQNKYGMLKEMFLSKRGDEFKFSKIPVYQGFLSYQELPAEIKDEIKQIVDERYNSDSPEIKASGLKLKEEFDDSRVNAWAQRAAEFVQQGEIIEFLGKLKQLFKLFCSDNSL